MSDPEFRGSGSAEQLGIAARWQRSEKTAVDDVRHPDHPAGYIADPGLVDAVNTALVLGRPLLLTGRPGTGKSELAERVAWEFGLGAVLRFEAQSLTEAQDLFYRFDLVGQMADAQLARPAVDGAGGRAARPARDFVAFGPLGKAILRAAPERHADLLAVDRLADGEPEADAGSVPLPTTARRSVVLIDEIDKAARDVPNDLLNGIQRLEFRIRELQHRLVAVPDEASRPPGAPSLRPIVLITSNAERDLPEPFLRRCVYFHIPDPDRDKLRRILRSRVFPGDGGGALPPFYEGLLDFYVDHRDHGTALAYQPGTSELLDWTRALKRQAVADQADLAANAGALARTLSAVAKHRDDLQALVQRLGERGVSLDGSPAA